MDRRLVKMVKDKEIHVNSYKMNRNGKEVIVTEHNRQSKGVTKEFPVKVKGHDLTRNGKQFISQNIEEERKTLIENRFITR